MSFQSYHWFRFKNNVTSTVFSIFRKLGIIDFNKVLKKDNNRRTQRAIFLDENQQKKIVFFCFRDVFILDWFLPIQKALESIEEHQVSCIIIDYGSTLKSIRTPAEYLNYQTTIDQKLLDYDLNPACHFSDSEFETLENRPQPTAILTSETIAKDKIQSPHQIYLPHYCVSKASDRLPDHRKFNHVFVPARKPYFLNEIEHQLQGAELHSVGYPKMFGPQKKGINPFGEEDFVLYAPSNDKELVLEALDAGILETFSRLKNIHFLIKLHPTLASSMKNLKNLLESECKKNPNIHVAQPTNIQQLAQKARLMITDFGSVGAEFRLSEKRRLVYLKTKKEIAIGGDTHFRDRHADAISEVKDLETVLPTLLNQPELTDEEAQEMLDQVLFNPQNADQVAAETLLKMVAETP